MNNEILYSDEISYLKLSIESGKINNIESHFKISEDMNQEIEWSMNVTLKSIFPYIKFIHNKDNSLIVGFDLYNLEPLNIYPSDKQVENEIQINKKRNQEIHNQQKEDLKKLGIDMDNPSTEEDDDEIDDELAEAFGDFFEEMYVEDDNSKMAFPTNHEDCIKQMKKDRLVESIEELMSQILELSGVIEAFFSFRNSIIDNGEEIFTTGTSEDGVYICSQDELADIKEW